MSNRQLKRLQQLAVPAQLLDSDDDEEPSEVRGGSLASTAASRFSVKPKKSDGKRRPPHPSVDAKVDSTAGGSSEAKESTPARAAAPSAKVEEIVAVTSPTQQTESERGDTGAASVESKRKEKKMDQRRKKREKELAEEALLERVASAGVAPELSGRGDRATLRAPAEEANAAGTTHSHNAVPSATAAGDCDTRGSSSLCVAELLTCCDPKQLNTRTERIKCFGVESVEDVGDSLGSRRGAGSAAHHHGGGGGGNPLLPSRPPGFALPTFRSSPFVTPNRYNWPAFTSLGVSIQRVTSSSSSRLAEQEKQPATAPCRQESARGRQHSQDKCSCRRSVFQVNWSDAEFQRAQANFERVVESLADVNTLLQQCFVKYPYHPPTLLQLHQTFAVMGDQPNSQLMLDLALYAVGVYLSAFPIGRPVTERCLPMALSSNRLVFETLKQGVFLAVKRGCNRTAFQLAKFLLSLDESDPCAMLLTWDYYALRAREWDSLLQLFSACERRWQREVDAAFSTIGEAVETPSSASAQATSGSEIEEELSTALYALPSFHFNAALAKFLLEEAEQDPGSRTVASGGEPRHSRKGSRAHAEPEQTQPASDGAVTTARDTARTMLAKACLRFPAAAWQLVEKNNIEVNTSTDAGWALLRDLRQSAPGAALRMPSHLATLFVERSHELWKSKEATNFLVRSVSLLGDANLFAPELHFQLRFQRETFATEPLVRRYQTVTAEDLCGTRVTPIAPEMLNPAANPDEVLRDAREREAFELRAQGFPQGELDALLRFEAVFGPLPVDIPVDQRLRMYDDMLQEFRAQIGQERNPLALFLETLLPWNNLRDMALDRAMAQRGVEDPVRRRNERQRRRDEDVWRAADQEAQARDDEASSSDDGGW